MPEERRGEERYQCVLCLLHNEQQQHVVERQRANYPLTLLFEKADLMVASGGPETQTPAPGDQIESNRMPVHCNSHSQLCFLHSFYLLYGSWCVEQLVKIESEVMKNLRFQIIKSVPW